MIREQKTRFATNAASKFGFGRCVDSVFPVYNTAKLLNVFFLLMVS